MLIFLIGQSGSGKSYWANQLSSLPNFTAVDTDKIITKELAQSIAAVFRDKGELFFREAEKKVLHKIIREHQGKHNVLVATGGGTPCYAGNMELMLKSGIVIYLEAAVPLLVQRLKHTADRPLLAKGYEEELSDILQKQLNDRKNVYEMAHYKIDISTATSATFAAVILSAQNQN